MQDLFKKLNTLVKASINDFLGREPSHRKSLRPDKLGENIDREIAALRQRINEAVEYENELQARVQSLRDEVVRWDRQADDAVAAGQDAAARYAIEQMQRAQQRLAMAESDLREHQVVTQELIQRVNTLEAVVADSRRTQVEASAGDAEQAPPTSWGLSDVLRDAHETINRMGELLMEKDETTSPEDATTAQPASQQAVEDDLASRRQRLSKPTS